MTLKDPVLVLYTAKKCPYCIQLESGWKTTINTLKAKFNLRTVTVEGESTIKPNFDTKLHPGGLRKYGQWFPMLLLVPGNSWDHAMSNLAIQPPVDLAGIQIMNTEKDKTDNFVMDPDRPAKIKMLRMYNPASVTDCVKWIEEAMKAPDFVKAQKEGPLKSRLENSFPKVQPQQIVNIVKPPTANNNNVCRDIKIIPRTKTR